MRQITIILISILTAQGVAQENGEDKWGSWHMYFGTNKVSDKLSIHSEVQVRYYEQLKNFNQLLLRTGLNYHINESAIATLGYGFIATDGSFEEMPNERDVIEHRIFQQFILKNKVEKVAFEHRYRLEQRFLDFGNTNDTQHRARYRLQVTVPLTNVLFLNFYDEVFLNLQNEVFGQNRLYAAMGFHVFKDISLQVGYLKNHFRSAHFDRLQIGVFINTDLRGNNKNKADEPSKSRI